jgi:hypothetical protein
LPAYYFFGILHIKIENGKRSHEMGPDKQALDVVVSLQGAE